VFKNGELVVRDGQVVGDRWGRALSVRPGYERGIDRRMSSYCDERYGRSPDFMKVAESAVGRPDPFELVPCRA
jgi:formylmethanofuran dehydrogenase subunit A